VTVSLLDAFASRAALSARPTLPEVVNAVKAIPYGRPRQPGPWGVVEEWKGTCSSKHTLLSALLRIAWPELRCTTVHRVYLLDTDTARRQFGEKAARAVPEEGLWDVHRYLVLSLDGSDVVVDSTDPNAPDWDGASDMPLACPDGQDVPAGPDPDAEKARLQEVHCDPAVREPFIRALTDALNDPPGA
jgi:hypothetical protein